MDESELCGQDCALKTLLLGADGQIGWELRRSLSLLGEVIPVTRTTPANRAFDLEAPDLLRDGIRRVSPDIIVNAAAYTAVDAAENDVQRARLVNAAAVGVMAAEAASLGSLLVHYSTDYVFDGSGSTPWQEDDATGPLGVYGQTKLEGEQLIRDSGCRHMIFRTSWVYASRGKNFLLSMLRLARERDRLSVVDDQIGSPTGADLIADVTSLAIRDAMTIPTASGTWHLVASGATSWHGYATHILETARRLGIPIRVAPENIAPCRTEDFPTPARRPRNSRLATAKIRGSFGIALPDWTDGVNRTIAEICTQ